MNKHQLEKMSIGELLKKNWNRLAELIQRRNFTANPSDKLRQEISMRIKIQNSFAGSRGLYGTCRSSEEANREIKEEIIKSFCKTQEVKNVM